MFTFQLKEMIFFIFLPLLNSELWWSFCKYVKPVRCEREEGWKVGRRTVDKLEGWQFQNFLQTSFVFSPLSRHRRIFISSFWELTALSVGRYLWQMLRSKIVRERRLAGHGFPARNTACGPGCYWRIVTQAGLRWYSISSADHRERLESRIRPAGRKLSRPVLHELNKKQSIQPSITHTYFRTQLTRPPYVSFPWPLIVAFKCSIKTEKIASNPAHLAVVFRSHKFVYFFVEKFGLSLTVVKFISKQNDNY